MAPKKEGRSLFRAHVSESERERLKGVLAELRKAIVAGTDGHLTDEEGAGSILPHPAAPGPGPSSSSSGAEAGPAVDLPPDADDVDRALALTPPKTRADPILEEPGAEEPDEEEKKGTITKMAARYAPIVRAIPNDTRARERERILRYLALYEIPRPISASFIETVDFEDSLRSCGAEADMKTALLRMPRKVALALYSNLVEGGDGLAAVPP